MSRPTEAQIARVLAIAGDMYWRQRFGLHTGDVVIVRIKDSASTSLADRQLERDPSENEGSERSHERHDLPAPNAVRRHDPPSWRRTVTTLRTTTDRS